MPVQAENRRPAPIGPATNDPGWAWAPYEPDAKRPWNLALAAHLYRRCGFGAGWEQLQQALSDGPQRTVDKLLRPRADVDAFNRRCDESENTAAGSVDGLRAWWLRRMMETPHPLLEKMTLFWHSYFAVNAGRGKQPATDEGARAASPRPRPGLFRLSVAGHRARSGHARLAGGGCESQGRSQRRLRPAPPGDVHVGTGTFRRRGCSGGGQSVHGPVRAAGAASRSAPGAR